MSKAGRYLVDFTSHAVYAVCVGVVGIVVHLVAQNPRELVVHRVSESVESGTAVRLDKSSVDVRKERERNPP